MKSQTRHWQWAVPDFDRSVKHLVGHSAVRVSKLSWQHARKDSLIWVECTSNPQIHGHCVPDHKTVKSEDQIATSLYSIFCQKFAPMSIHIETSRPVNYHCCKLCWLVAWGKRWSWVSKKRTKLTWKQFSSELCAWSCLIWSLAILVPTATTWSDQEDTQYDWHHQQTFQNAKTRLIVYQSFMSISKKA